MRTLVFPVMVLSFAASAARAADADVNRAYDYRIILHIAPHRLLTPTFRRQLAADLQDGIQGALGALANISVGAAAPNDPWIDPAALAAKSDVSPAKRHYVDVSFVDGQYVIRARQLDGATGLAGPVVRQARTTDRAFVGRLIMRIVEQDFGPVGTVVAFEKATDRATLSFRGGALRRPNWPASRRPDRSSRWRASTAVRPEAGRSMPLTWSA